MQMHIYFTYQLIFQQKILYFIVLDQSVGCPDNINGLEYLITPLLRVGENQKGFDIIVI